MATNRRSQYLGSKFAILQTYKREMERERERGGGGGGGGESRGAKKAE